MVSPNHPNQTIPALKPMVLRGFHHEPGHVHPTVSSRSQDIPGILEVWPGNKPMAVKGY